MAKGGPGGMGNMGDLIKQAQQMQKQMAKAQEDLKQRVVEGSAGGGMVKCMVNGAQEVLSVKLDPEVLKDDPEMLEDLIAAAVNQGLKKSQELAQKEMSKLTGGLGIPGLF